MSTICESDQIPLETTGDMLCKVFGNIHVSRERLDKAIRERNVHLWCSGSLVSAEYFAGQLRIAIGEDERFTVAGTSALPGNMQAYKWTVSCEDLAELVKSEQSAKSEQPADEQPAHATISNQATPPDIAFIRSLAKARGWSEDRFCAMPTAMAMRILGADLKKIEGDTYRARSRSTYRRAQGRSC